MSELARNEPLDNLQTLLDQQGIDVLNSNGITSDEMSLDLRTSRIYGFETELPDGGLGRLVLRQVHQRPTAHIAGLLPNDERVKEFNASKLSGLFVDARVASSSRDHLFVARKSIVTLANRAGTTHASLTTNKQFSIGRAVRPSQVLALDTAGIEVSRVLSPDEIDYTEPSVPTMVLAALRHRIC